MKKPKKPKKARSQIKHPSLVKKYNSRVRQEFLDADYLHLLNPEELAFYAKFMEEENNASFKNDGTDFNKTKEERKKIYDRNNFRNRDQWGLTNAKVAATNLLNYEDYHNLVEDEYNRDINPANMENSYIEFIDDVEIKEMMEEYANAMLAFRDSV